MVSRKAWGLKRRAWSSGSASSRTWPGRAWPIGAEARRASRLRPPGPGVALGDVPARRRGPRPLGVADGHAEPGRG
eukprot:7369368-Lingulodinium_polyedra.AAC.1